MLEQKSEYFSIYCASYCVYIPNSQMCTSSIYWSFAAEGTLLAEISMWTHKSQ